MRSERAKELQRSDDRAPGVDVRVPIGAGGSVYLQRGRRSTVHLDEASESLSSSQIDIHFAREHATMELFEDRAVLVFECVGRDGGERWQLLAENGQRCARAVPVVEERVVKVEQECAHAV